MKKSEIIGVISVVLLSVIAIIAGSFYFDKSDKISIAETTSVISEETTVPEKTEETTTVYRHPECTFFEHGDDGRVVEGELTEGLYFEYEFDSDKNKTKESCYSENGDFVYEIDYGLVDGEWRVIHNRYYDAILFRGIIDNTYDYDREGCFYAVTQRNEKGRIFAECFYNEDDFLFRYESYDIKGNIDYISETDPVTKHEVNYSFSKGTLDYIEKRDENRNVIEKTEFGQENEKFTPDDRTVSTEKKYNSNGTFRIYEYDKDGLLIKENYFDKDGIFTFYDLYKYNDKGQLIKDSFYHATDFLIAYETYLYNEEYQLIEKEGYIFGEMGPVDSEIMTYDENGNLIRKDVYEKRELSYYLTYSYDKDYVLSGMEQYTKDGVLKEKYVIELDAYGRVKRADVYSREGVMKYYGTFVYEEGGNIIETHYSPDGTLLEELNKTEPYENKGMPIE